jgi:aminocarboxymuconate-semialdehyde decarboxylase
MQAEGPVKSALLDFVSCRTGVAPAGGGRVVRGPKGLVSIDIHSHVLSKRAEKFVDENHKGQRPAQLQYANALTRKVAHKQVETVLPKQTEMSERYKEMDRSGVDIQALSPAPPHFYYFCEPGVGRDASRLVNDDIAAMAATDPKHFVALGTLPLQDTQLAVEELRRCMKQLGMRGVEIAHEVNGEELSCARLEPFFAAAEELGAVVFLHPTGFVHPRFGEHYFSNVIGNPLNSTIAVSYLIFDGTLERHPKLKLVVAHGGGFLASYPARMDHAHAAREDCRVTISKPPSEYLKRLYFDTIVFDPEHLAYLVKRFGADHIVLGTDFPFDMAEDHPVDLVLKAPGLTDEQKIAICGGNAAKLLGIKLPVA